MSPCSWCRQQKELVVSLGEPGLWICLGCFDGLKKIVVAIRSLPRARRKVS